MAATNAGSSVSACQAAANPPNEASPPAHSPAQLSPVGEEQIYQHGDLQHRPKPVRNQLPPVYLVIATSLASTLPSHHLLGGTLLLSHGA